MELEKDGSGIMAPRKSGGICGDRRTISRRMAPQARLDGNQREEPLVEGPNIAKAIYHRRPLIQRKNLREGRFQFQACTVARSLL